MQGPADINGFIRGEPDGGEQCPNADITPRVLEERMKAKGTVAGNLRLIEGNLAPAGLSLSAHYKCHVASCPLFAFFRSSLSSLFTSP